MQLNELIAKYVELRDKKAELATAAKEKIARIDVVLDKMEAALLVALEQSGAESFKTDQGTAYKTDKVSCTTADKTVFLEFIRANDLWPLLDARPLKAAIEEYKNEHGDIPPGLNWRSEKVVNVRRS